jgi:Xaa-Pro aminopeptidase
LLFESASQGIDMTAVPSREELNSRLNRFREIMRERKISAALITNEQNVRYLSGFTGNDSALLVTAHKKLLLTDFRYREEAHNSARGWRIIFEPYGLLEKAGAVAKKFRIRRLCVEAGHMKVADLRGLRKEVGRGVKIHPQDAMVGELRLIKSDWEVQQIENALRIQEACFLELCRGLRSGISEREAAAKLRLQMVRSGADDEAFQCMFQIGSHSSLPHGRPTDRVLNGDSIILLDWGAKLGGYHSDLTRTFFIGSISPQLRRIHEIVSAAQRAAIEKIAPGVEMKDVDKAARDVIAKAGFGKAFGHSTGHGLGLDIHEFPSLSMRAKGTLKPGMVVTVEPGIYIPRLGGVRIEDDVLVTKTGHRVLSRLSSGLRWNGDNN